MTLWLGIPGAAADSDAEAGPGRDFGQSFVSLGDQVSAAQYPRLTPGLIKRMSDPQSGDELRVIIQFPDQEVIRQWLPGLKRGVRRQELIRRLKENADRSQARVIRFLEQKERQGLVRQPRRFWIANAIAVSASREVIAELAGHPDIVSICEDEVLTPPDLPGAAPLLDPQSYVVEDRVWGLDKVQVQRLWDQGLDGTGVIVANLDSGVDVSHPDLAGKMAVTGSGEPGWFDANSWYAFPLDQHGHGTHTMGTMVGGQANALGLRIGVAPGSRFYAVRIFGPQPAYYSVILWGAQWIMDPDYNPATDDAADIVNNSWGTATPGSCNEWFRQMVSNWRAAGILPVFSAGNAGPNYGTVSDPGNYPESLAVGSTDREDQVAATSSRGPVEYDGRLYIQPGMAAPGVGIISARAADTDMYAGSEGYVPGSNIVGTDLYLASGTSMAAPHVAGMAALLRQAHPDWTVEDLQAALTETAAQIAASPLAAGNGRLTAENMDQVAVVLQPQSIHFGKFTGFTVTQSRQQVVTVHNVSQASQTWQLLIDGPAVSGITCAVSPSAVTLAPGASATAMVTATVDPTAAPFVGEAGLWAGRLTACAGGDFCPRIPVVLSAYEQTIDNDSGTGFTRSGIWTLSSAAPGYYGANYLTAAKGTAGVARYTFSGLAAGTYRPSAQWSAFENRATNATYTVKVNGVTVGSQVFNQQINGGIMNAFAAGYAVPAGATLEVELSAVTANGYVIADAVLLSRVPDPVVLEKTIDNDSGTGFTRSGIWTLSSAVPGYYGANYLAAAKGTAGVARYIFSGLAAGTYRPSAQWSAFENRATNATYTVKVNGVTVGSQVFNQQINGGIMNAFAAGYAVPAGATLEVELSAATANGYVIADAVLLSPVPEPVYEETIDNDSGTGFTRGGTWTLSSAVPGYYGANYLTAAKGTAGVARYTFSGLAAGTYRPSAQWSAFENRATNATYTVKVNGVKVGSQVFNQQINGGIMNAFAAGYAVPAGATLEVELSAVTANGYVIADAVRLVARP